MLYLKKAIIAAATFCCLAVPVYAQESLSHYQFEQNMASLGQNPRDLGMEVVRMCRIFGQSTTAGPNKHTVFEPCDKQTKQDREVQRQRLMVSEPGHQWRLESEYYWLPLTIPFMSQRVKRQSVVTSPVVTITGTQYRLPADRATLSAYDQCQPVFIVVEEVRYSVRKPGCVDE